MYSARKAVRSTDWEMGPVMWPVWRQSVGMTMETVSMRW